MSDSLLERVVAALGHQYRIESEIGRGGMSVVYRARDLRLNRTVAVKVLPPELAYDPAVGTRFMREAQTSAQLSHPHIVPIFDVGERDGITYFVMAHVGGGNLAAMLERHALRPIDETRRVLAEVADALAYAHLRGVIHRDIKADNILLDGESGRSMVTDFGIARAIEGGSRLTLTGIAVGTPAYMSPEQAVGDRDVDGRSDIYSLGVLGYQMLTGRVPFSAGNPMALLLKHVTERPTPIAELRPEAPRALVDAIERALMKSPAERWPTATAFREAILSNESVAVAWRAEAREPVRYASPVPRSAAKRNPRPPEPQSFKRVADHLEALTDEQRADLRLWNGRVDVLDRMKTMRRYTLATVALSLASLAGLAGAADVPPLVLGPLIPIFMWVRVSKRAASLKHAGLRTRKVLLALRARRALPAAAATAAQQLEKLAPCEVLDGPRGASVRRAAADRVAINEILAKLPKVDRAAVPDVEPTVNALVQRIAELAQVLHEMDTEADPRFATQRAELARQLDNAELALGNLRLDLIRLRSSGIGAAGGVSSATQQARALSRDIDSVLDAAGEVRDL